jgi:hypothetical protein
MRPKSRRPFNGPIDRLRRSLRQSGGRFKLAGNSEIVWQLLSRAIPTSWGSHP